MASLPTTLGCLRHVIDVSLKSKGPVPPGAMARPSTSLEYPSMGSYGHPLSCAYGSSADLEGTR